MKVNILAIGVHPDDIELSCCGTLLSHMAQGKTVGLLDLTRGELGSRGSAELRDKEAAHSAQIMGAAFRNNLRMADGFFQYTPENIKKIIRVIRACQPDVVLANSLDDRHPDHGRAAKLVADACYYSGLLRIETTDKQGQAQQKWRPQAVYHYIQDKNLSPDFVVDITAVMKTKEACISAFSSQFYVADTQDQFAAEVKTPISGKDFMDFIRAKARVFGRPAGFEFAEGFNVGRTLGVKDLFTLT